MTHQEVKALADKYVISLGSALNFLREDVDPGDARQYLSVKKAARIMRTSPTTLYKRIKRGEVDAERVCGMITISVVEVMSHLAPRLGLNIHMVNEDLVP